LGPLIEQRLVGHRPLSARGGARIGFGYLPIAGGRSAGASRSVASILFSDRRRIAGWTGTGSTGRVRLCY